MNPKRWFLAHKRRQRHFRAYKFIPIYFLFMTPASKGIAVVTGSAGALGKAIASQLAQYGYNIALNDISTKNNSALEALAEDIRKRGRKAIVVVGDVTVEK
jgi:NADP-dependent 3-hydroxy acid dehydrogenase YdfG